MYLGLCLVSVFVVVWAVTAFAARGRAVRPDDPERRDTLLRVCPARATMVDVERQLRAHPLTDPAIVRVLGTAAERRIGAATLWSWIDRFGADKLVLALDAEVAERRLQRHLDADTTPDWEAMWVFADLNGEAMPFAEIIDLDLVTEIDGLRFDLAAWETCDAPAAVVPDVDLSQFGPLPPIYDPGLPVVRSVTPALNLPAGPWPGSGTDWPRVA